MTRSDIKDFRRVVDQACTLEERIRLHGRCQQLGDGTVEDQRRLAVWISWFEKISGASWKRFCDIHRITPLKLARLRRGFESRARVASWVDVLFRLWIYLQRHTFESHPDRTIARNIAEPLVEFAWCELLLHRPASLQLISAAAAERFRESLLKRLTFTSDAAIAWEERAALSAIAVARINSRKKDEYFFAGGISHKLLGLLTDYPGLARLWCRQIENWSLGLERFIERAAGFTGAGKHRGEEGVIKSVMPDFSDPHLGNQTVISVWFGNGRRYFYKPRPGYYEDSWFCLLELLNREGFPTPFRSLHMACRNDYCWMEAVSPQPPRTRKQREAYDQRFGALMYLVQLLGGVDFHAENVVATGVQPVFVDCETLLHPDTSLPATLRLQKQSIFRTGLLPLGITANTNSGYSTSSLPPNGAKPGIFAGRDAPVFPQQVLQGFRAMHDFLRADAVRRKRLESILNRFEQHLGRRVYRPSCEYYSILEESVSPSLLRNGLDRSIYLFACCMRVTRSKRRLCAEISALEDCDIPVFYGKARPPNTSLSNRTFSTSAAILTKAFT